MNHIKRLQMDKAGAEAREDAYRFGIGQLIGYLTSEKFHEDTTVQTADVIHRLREIQTFADDQENEAIQRWIVASPWK